MKLRIPSKIAWHIDAFGLSKTLARILSASGYNALFINRINQREKEIIINKSVPELEFIWQDKLKNQL